MDELIHHYNTSGLLTMIVQEFIEWEQFVRCLSLGQEDVLPMKYDPRERQLPRRARSPVAGARRRGSSRIRRTLMRALGYDMCSLEFAVRDGVPYAIDFMNPAPDMDINSLTPHYFEWVVTHMADMVIRLAKARRKQARARERASSCSAAASAMRDVSAMLRDGIDAYHELLTDDARRRVAAAARRAAAAARPVLRRPRALHRAAAALSVAGAVSLSPAARVPSCCAPFARRISAALADDALLAQFRLDRLGERARARRSRLSRREPGLAPRRVLRRRSGRAEASPSTTPRRRPVARTTTCSPKCSSACRSCASSCARGTCVRCRRDTTCFTRCSTRTSSGRARATLPRIAIVDWSDVPTQSEFLLFQDYFTRQGLECVIVDPREVEYDGKRLARRARRHRSDLQARADARSSSNAAGSTTRSCAPCATARSAW